MTSKEITLLERMIELKIKEGLLYSIAKKRLDLDEMAELLALRKELEDTK